MSEPRDDQAIDRTADPDLVDDADQAPRRGWAGWLISGSFHAMLLLIMWGVYWVIHDPVTEAAPLRTAQMDPPPKKPERPKLDRQLDPKIELQVPEEVEKPSPYTQLQPDVDVSEREDLQEDPVPKGREEAIADSEYGGVAFSGVIGTGGPAAGMFGARSGSGKKRAIGRFGGSPGSESAVDHSLTWFKRHQSPNGCWDVEKYHLNCAENGKCEPGQALEWGTTQGTNVAMTGYALLCFLGAGYDHQTPNRYRSVVKKGIDWLVSVQLANGYLGVRNYENAVGTMALCEAYAMTGDPALKEPAQKGVNAILAQQNQAAGAKDKNEGYGSGLGWDYNGPSMRNDSSVTGWNVMALKSALAGQLNVGNGMEGAKRWLETTWKATNPEWAKLDPYKDESRFPYTYASDSGKVDISAGPAWMKDLSCVGSVCAVFLGHHSGDTMLETMLNYVSNHQMPTAWPCNTYYLYYNTMAVFQAGGERWKKWNSSVRDLLVKSQRRTEDCFDGSWDFQGTMFPMDKCGRILSTAYCCLSLEVYYRYGQQAAGAKH